MSTKAQVLVQLLEKVPDTNKLQRLLEPENLLYLLTQYGYQRDDLQQRLKNGTLPGEFLLELLEQEPDSEYLLVMLSNTMDTKVEKRVVIDEIIKQKKQEEAALKASAALSSQASSLSRGLSAVTMSDERSSIFERPPMMAAIVIVTLTAIIPALLHTGFFSEFNIVLSPAIALIIALIGGAVAGALFAHTTDTPRWKGILIGIVLNVGVLLTTIVYTAARISLFKIEIAIPLLLGSLPALLLYLILIGIKTP